MHAEERPSSKAAGTIVCVTAHGSVGLAGSDVAKKAQALNADINGGKGWTSQTKGLSGNDLAARAALPLGKEIGGLRAAVAYVKSKERAQRTSITSNSHGGDYGGSSEIYSKDDQLSVVLMHSTGLRSPIPLRAMRRRLREGSCAAFALEVPWFRYEVPGGRFYRSRYGAASPALVSSNLVLEARIIDGSLIAIFRQVYSEKIGSIPSAFSQNSEPNELWHGNTNGALAAPWSFIQEDFRKLGFLSDVARDECGNFKCSILFKLGSFTLIFHFFAWCPST